MILVGLWTPEGSRQAYRLFPTPHPLRRYARVFPTVELSWWHRLPDFRTIARLRSETPKGFRFSAWGHKHLSFRPTGEERRLLRRLLRRFNAFGEQRGALRIHVPPLSEEGFSLWLDLLEEMAQEKRPAVALEVPLHLEPLALARGFSLVNKGGPFYYLLDPKELPRGNGFAYFSDLEGALLAKGSFQTEGMGLDS
ncbi:MAG: DUF72 domain-containing protein [Thermaceae bacterium]